MAGTHAEGVLDQKISEFVWENNAQNLICIAKMAAVGSEPYDWLRPKNRLDDVTSDKIREFCIGGGGGKPRWRLCILSPMIGR